MTAEAWSKEMTYVQLYFWSLFPRTQKDFSASKYNLLLAASLQGFVDAQVKYFMYNLNFISTPQKGDIIHQGQPGQLAYVFQLHLGFQLLLGKSQSPLLFFF